MDNPEFLGEEIASLCAHLDAATHHLLQLIRNFDTSGCWCDQGAMSCAHWLSWRVGWDPGTAREKVRVARALGELPAVDEALRTGRLSYSKVRAITRVVTPATEAKLLDLALIATGGQLERLCRGYRAAKESEEGQRDPDERFVRRGPTVGGGVKLTVVLEPDEAELVMRAVDRAREVDAEQARQARQAAVMGDVSAEARWPSSADGMVRLAESYLAGNRRKCAFGAGVTGNGGERFQVVVHLDQEVLGGDGELGGTLEDGTHVSAETLRRVACDCGLVAVGHDGQALDIGRRTRSIPPAIRRALTLRDHGCAFPGCTHGRFLHAHHVQHWLHGGRTSMENLLLLCSFHHHLVHEGGWKVVVGAEGEFSFQSPRSGPLPAVPMRRWTDDTQGWLRGWVQENGLEIGPRTNFPLWDGSKPNYDIAVCALVEAG